MLSLKHSSMQSQSKKISWRAPEYHYHEKSSNWFWVLGIITLAMMLAALILESFLFAILIAISGFTIAMYGARKPSTVTFTLDPRGIFIGEKLYDYESMDHFWIEYIPPHRKELLVALKKKFSHHITIMLGDADPEQARDYLISYIKEEKIEEPLITSIAHMMKF